MQALLNSLAANDVGQNGAQNTLTPEQVRNLSNKLGDIMGDIGLESHDSVERRNEKGEVCLASYSNMRLFTDDVFP